MSNKPVKEKVRIGVIGLGPRGRGMMRGLLQMPDVEVPAICDILEDRVKMGLDIIEEAGHPKAEGYTDYNDLIARGDLDAVYIPSTWAYHIPIAIAAMKAGIYAAPEAAGAASVEECWNLVRTYEETGVPCMMLENCNYGRVEMALLNMVKQNVFGELIHLQCGYEHDLRDEVALGLENQHYRIHNYMNRNGELYPTHGIGPMGKLLNINKGNRFVSLSSMSSKARGVHNWIVENRGADHPLAKVEFTQGDVVTTMVKCAHGETVLLIHDTTLPRPYSRAGRVQGTEGIWMEDNKSIHLKGISPEHQWEPFEGYLEKYEHPLWKEYINEGVRGGHGGMDYLVLRAFIESVKYQTPTPIDVYDTATWAAITVLSEQSIALGGSAVPFPDFTSGKWVHSTPSPRSKYSLDEVCDDLF